MWRTFAPQPSAPASSPTRCWPKRGVSPEYLRARCTPGRRLRFLEITDNGCGTDRDARERLFEPFFTTKFQGRCLGLAAVLGIVRSHGGTIQVYSEPGKGAGFKVLLPVSDDGAAEQLEPRPVAATWTSLSGTVLVVDDDELVRTVTRQMLELCGIDVLEAVDGEEALEIYREHGEAISLVLLDMTMPHMDGAETFRELRALNPAVRVLLASGYNEQDATNRFVGKGLAGFMQKPFTLEVLRAKIGEILPR